MSFKCKRCPKNSRCVRCRSKNATERQTQRAKDPAAEILEAYAYSGCAEHNPRDGSCSDCLNMPDDAWLLPPDDVTDLQAVSLAVHGERAVRLTYQERLLAARQILAYGGTEYEVVMRLNLKGDQWITKTHGTRLKHG